MKQTASWVPSPHRHRAFLGIGSNLGDRAANCREALARLEKVEHTSVMCVSGFYETEPVGFKEQERFINAAVELATDLDPLALLDRLLEVEQTMGRVRTVKWGPRLIDLDLLLYDDLTMKHPRLTLPHEFLHERVFVLLPLAEIAPDLVHPVRGMSIRALLESLPDAGTGSVRP